MLDEREGGEDVDFVAEGYDDEVFVGFVEEEELDFDVVVEDCAKAF